MPPPPPVKAITVATAGSSFAIATSLWIFCFIDWKEVSWSAMMLPDQAAGVLLREEVLGNDDVEEHVQAEGPDGDHEDEQRVVEDPCRGCAA